MLAFFTFNPRESRLSAYSVVSSSANHVPNKAALLPARHKASLAPAPPTSYVSESPNKRSRLFQDGVEISVVREMIKKAVSSLETELRSEKISKLSSSVTSIETELDNLKESLRTIIQINVQEKAGDRSAGNKKALNDVEDGLNKKNS
jgi:uncharacterized protein Yka (UPF0111/DUF47 family)